MKKTLIAAAIICAAVFSHGATVQWGGAVATPDGSDYLAAGTQAALLYSSTGFTGAATKLDGWAVGKSADNGGSVVQLYTLTAYDATTASAFSANYGIDGSVDGYYAFLVLNDAGNMASYYYAGQVSGTTGASAPTDLKVNYDWSGASYLTSGGYTTAVAPEPTSGLLLLLGMAGLALRRKRA